MPYNRIAFGTSTQCSSRPSAACPRTSGTARHRALVNAIAVGAVRAATLLDDAARYDLDPDTIGLTNASGRLGEPDEIGYGVLFFASDASSFCSGQTLYMHGGPGPAGV
ncbi:MAG: SDR family oxidoreductase [Acidimicrobiales bacterium]